MASPLSESTVADNELVAHNGLRLEQVCDLSVAGTDTNTVTSAAVSADPALVIVPIVRLHTETMFGNYAGIARRGEPTRAPGSAVGDGAYDAT